MVVPWRWREAAKWVLELPERLRFRKKLRRTLWRSAQGVLGLGGALDGRIHGGRVKLVALAERFGDSAAGYRVLYLVSSALPRFWDETVRWALGHGAKLVWNQNGVAYRAWAGAEYPRWNRPMRRGLLLASRVVYQSEFCQRSADRMLGKYKGLSVILLNPVDLEKFNPAECFRRGADKLKILAIGTHASPARVRLAIGTVGHLRRAGVQARLSVVGPLNWPQAEEQAARWVHEQGLREIVTFEGPFSRQEAPEIYRRHDILLHCKQMDPCPTVVAEAMASGLPIVGPANGGLPEMVGQEGGILIPAADDFDNEPKMCGELVAQAVVQVMESYQSYSSQARRRAERLFNNKAWLNAHGEIFERLTHG